MKIMDSKNYIQDNLKNITAKQLYHFAKINGFLNHSFEDVLNEYLTTKEVAESYGR